MRSTTPPAPLSCAMIFLRDLSRRAASSSPSPSPRGAGPLPSHDAETKILSPVLRDDCDDNQKSPKALRVRSRDYRAADGFKPQREIEAQESRRHAGLCYTHPASEHSICRSGLKLKGASGGLRRPAEVPVARRLASRVSGRVPSALLGPRHVRLFFYLVQRSIIFFW